MEFSGTFPIGTVAGLNFELAIRGREALCDESLVFTCHVSPSQSIITVIRAFGPPSYQTIIKVTPYLGQRPCRLCCALQFFNCA